MTDTPGQITPEAVEEAERLLPCDDPNGYCRADLSPGHNRYCRASSRPAVAAALQVKMDRIAELERVVEIAKRLADQFAMDPETSELQVAIAALSGGK